MHTSGTVNGCEGSVVLGKARAVVVAITSVSLGVQTHFPSLDMGKIASKLPPIAGIGPTSTCPLV